jgi:hypothetical protein
MAADPYKDTAEKSEAQILRKIEKVVEEVVEEVAENITSTSRDKIYKDYASFINQYYATPARMQNNIFTLQQFGWSDTDIENIQWGSYQCTIVQQALWPSEYWNYWIISVANARASLATVPNAVPVYPGAPGSIPPSQQALLDALVQLCFNSPAQGQAENGIPMTISVQVQPKGVTNNKITFNWLVAGSGQYPQDITGLQLIMWCPNP